MNRTPAESRVPGILFAQLTTLASQAARGGRGERDKGEGTAIRKETSNGRRRAPEHEQWFVLFFCLYFFLPLPHLPLQQGIDGSSGVTCPGPLSPTSSRPGR